MAFIFPEDKADFSAPNGVTYSWDGTKWVTKTFKADESVLADSSRLTTLRLTKGRRQDDAFAADQEAQDLAASELTERVSDGEHSSSGRLSWP